MHFVNIAGLNLNRNKVLLEIVEVKINGDCEMWSWVKNYVESWKETMRNFTIRLY